MSTESAPRWRQRISTLMLSTLTAIAGLILLGLIVMTVRLFGIQADLANLRDSALPRSLKLSELSQEASASISIAPALSAEPTRFEFETLLSRIKDKETSQKNLISELANLIADQEAAHVLRESGDLLIVNLGVLTNVVRQQIEVEKRLETHTEHFRKLARSLAKAQTAVGESRSDALDIPAQIGERASAGVFRILNMLLDPNRARLSRNRAQSEAGIEALTQTLGETEPADPADGRITGAEGLIEYWLSEQERINEDKQLQLSNEFKIKALVEENSLIANRLVSNVNNEFQRSSAELETQIGVLDQTIRFTLASMIVVVLAFASGNIFVWFVLDRRIFKRLDGMRKALALFADDRKRPQADPVADEIGVISNSLHHYMDVIDERETELKQLSDKLSKYLSPQIYDSIFKGEQDVRITSSRKKLTVFFSDIADFTETSDRLESEELTQLLNHYLTEMSQIALQHGATIDKFVGDAILIFFGDPETRGVKEDALACVKMAIAMRNRLRDLEDTWREAGIERPLRCRMGVHTGFCTVGNFGSEDRLDYTIIGSAVNTASRLESAAVPGEILISYETFAHVRDQISCEERGAIEVKGIAYPVAIYQVVNSFEDLTGERQRFHEKHRNMNVRLDLSAMTSEDRQQAERILRKALDQLTQAEAPDQSQRQVEAPVKDPET